MADAKHFDLIVIGGGPGGYVGAIRAAQLGKKVACVERSKLGGVCLNWGCIPTKALLHAASVYTEAFKHGGELGFEVDPKAVKVDWGKVMGRSRDVAGKLNGGVGFLFKKNKIEHVQGHARIESGKTAGGPCKVVVAKADDDYYHGTGKSGAEDVVLTADKVLIATGAAPRNLPFAPADGKTIISSYEALSLPAQPKSIVIVGSGAIGMEFAYFFNSFGTDVTVVEMLDRIMPNEDEDISKEALKIFGKQGIKFKVGCMTKAVTKTAGGAKVEIEDQATKKSETLEAEKVLVAIGVAGRFDGLFDAKLGLKVDKGHIVTDCQEKKDKATYATSVPGIYAIGDVIGPPWLAHVSMEEAVTAVERMYGHASPGVHYDTIPGATYCNPQVASVGMTEKQCKEKGIEYRVGKYGLRSHGKAIADGAADGLVKILVSKKYGEILGGHIIGENASELIHEVCVTKALEGTLDDIIATMHAHPTMAESVHEAALGADNRMIHA